MPSCFVLGTWRRGKQPAALSRPPWSPRSFGPYRGHQEHWRTLGHLLVRLGSCASRWTGAAASAPVFRPLRGGGDEGVRRRPDGDEGGAELKEELEARGEGKTGNKACLAPAAAACCHCERVHVSGGDGGSVSTVRIATFKFSYVGVHGGAFWELTVGTLTSFTA
jgi:hypothetical protein